MEYFKRQTGGYTTEINPLNNYMAQAITFVMTYLNTDKVNADRIVRNAIKDKGPTNPDVEYRARKINGDRELRTAKLSDYIKDTVRDGDIIVPSFTVYDHPDKNRSLHSDFLKINIERRSKHKELAFAAYQSGDMNEFVRNDVLQKVMKIFNNSLSGAYASKSTSLYNPSQHYTLTSMTRAVASIGNAVSESVIAGNKCLYTPDSVMNYITSIITIVDLKQVASAINMYKLHTPSAEEVMKMLCYSSDRYWTNVSKKKIILDYLLRLNEIQLTAVMYVNDLFHLRMYNDAVIKDFVGSLGSRVTTGVLNPLKVLNIDLEGVNNLVHHVCMEDIRGMKVKYSKLVDENPEVLDILGATAENIYKVLNKYRILLKAFFITDILPIDIGNIKDSYRDVIVLSDTDSTCGSYDNWTHWYYGYDRFTPEAVGLSAAVMTINTQVIDHNIKVFAKNMNVEDSSVELLKMKNEYFWSVFVTANVSKHYFANTWIQEGNVYAKPKLELKGVHLIASAGNQDVAKIAHDGMTSMLTAIENGVKLNPKEILKGVANIERKILTAVDNGDISMFKLDKIKEPSAYKVDDMAKTPYFHHQLWKDVFMDKYGDPGEPTYMVVKIPTILKSKRLLTEYLAGIEDETIKDKLEICLAKHNKQMLGTFRIPLTIAGGSGVPKEILGAIDKQRIVLDNMNIFYIQLETLGIFRKPSMLFSDMGY